MITILSPHLDDAAFSLGVVLTVASRRSLRVRVVNCFTQSGYAPYSDAVGAEAVSGLRAQEEQAFLDGVGALVESVDLGLEDTSLRPGYERLQDSFHRRVFSPDEDALGRHLVACFEGLLGESLVFVPMAYGNHVDHRLVRAAAERVFEPATRVYYEELPYSLNAPRRALRRQVNDPGCEAVLVAANEEVLASKLRGISCYASQLPEEQAQAILARARQLGGERLWAATAGREVLGKLGLI